MAGLSVNKHLGEQFVHVNITPFEIFHPGKGRQIMVGGRLRIISSPNKGTTVKVSLPLNGSG
jgi:hypothetical protein